MFNPRLEAEHDAGSEAGIVLRGVEKRSADEVSLEAPGEQMEDFVIQTAANCSDKGCVGAESVGVDVSGGQSRKRKQNEAENPTLAHNHPPSAWVTRMYAESCWMRDGVFG